MKNLSISLIFVVVTAVIGLGWLLTEINFRNSSGESALSEELAAYQQLGKEIARALDTAADKQAVIERWQAQSAFAVRLQERSALPVPDELLANFNSSGSLILQSANNVSLHFLLPESNQVLSLIVPDEVAAADHAITSLVLTFAFYICVAGILLLWLYPLIRRRTALNAMAQKFGQGDLASRIKPSRFSYIADIETEVNHMAERIQALINDNKLLSRAVSHNLKTPLARLRFGLDTLEETEDAALRKKYSARMNKDLIEMESLVETLLQYAKLDESRVELHKQTLELNAFVAQLFKDIENHAVTILYKLADTNTSIEADPNYLAMQLNNIMDNALQHARTRINVTVSSSTTNVRLMIEDDGDGIPASARDEVVKPFWRGGHASTTKGHGMGLAIVARIAEWFSADLLIDTSRELGGAAITLQFTGCEHLKSVQKKPQKHA